MASKLRKIGLLFTDMFQFWYGVTESHRHMSDAIVKHHSQILESISIDHSHVQHIAISDVQ